MKLHGRSAVISFICVIALVILSFTDTNSTSRATFPTPILRRLSNEWPNSTLAWHTEFDLLTINGKPVIWMFWDTGKPPPIIQLCITAMICHNEGDAHVQLVSESEVYKWLPNVHPALPYLIGAHKADYFRARILDEYGGLYVDSDAVPLQTTKYRFDKLRWYDVASYMWTTTGEPISITAIGPIRARTVFTANWVTQLHVTLDKKLSALKRYKSSSNGYPLLWAEICGDIVKKEFAKLLENTAIRYHAVNGETTVGQFIHDFMKSSKAEFKIVETPFVYWHYSQVKRRVVEWSIDQIFEQDVLLVELLAYSMSECKQRRESGPAVYDSHVKPRSFTIGGKSKSLYRVNTTHRNWIKNEIRKNFA